MQQTGSRLWPILGLAVWLAACGCARDERLVLSMEERLQASLPEPPPVLSIPVLALYTNQPGFGAHCRLDRIPPIADRKPLEGALLHRRGEFLFAGEAREKNARGREMTFIWNFAANRGHALNDALPGYAPLAPRAQLASAQSTGRTTATEKVNGRLCSQEKITMTLTDGSETQLTVWRATDLNGLPVRIRSESGSARFVVDLTDVRVQEPAAALFEIPRDFTRYESPKAIFDELFRRESLTRRSNKPRPAWDDEEFLRTGTLRQD